MGCKKTKVRQVIINEIFYKKIAEKGKLYSRIWFYWLGNFLDELFDSDFLEKQKFQNISNQEIIEIYEYGCQFLRQDFKLINNKKVQVKIPKFQIEIAENVIDYLNEKTNRNFKKNNTNFKLIIARLKDGYNIEDLKWVIDKKTNDWLGTSMQEYLRPITLFGNKFENYINLKNDKPSKTSFEQFALSIAAAQSISFRRK